ncbi:MAG: hypothetical protein FJ304_17820 [Planctomycetes bacterium]|nr:hypothetical protein [Planctomycetota bacterium]
MRDALDDDTDRNRDDALNALQVAKAYLYAHELGLVRPSECPENLLNREGARRKLDSLIPLLRVRVGAPVAAPPEVPQRRPKRSTERGEAEVKLIAALTKHHKYAEGGRLNEEPVGNNQLARLAGVDGATAHAFFVKHFKGHKRYANHYCKRKGFLNAALKYLNGEYTADALFGRIPPDEGDRDDE